MKLFLIPFCLCVFLATVVSAAATADDFVVPAITAPRIILQPENPADCFAPAAPVTGDVDDVSVRLVIAADGAVTKISLPDGSPGWMNGLTDCVLDKVKFAPALRNGVAVEFQASLALRFSASGTDRAGVGIEKVGPLMTAPRLVQMPEGTDDCFPAGIAKRGSVARFVISLTIMPDGEVTDVKMPLGSEPWYEKTARCVLERVVFIPGTSDGSPVAAQSSLPIVYKTVEGNVSSPQLRSSDEEIEIAYRACYPSGLNAIASAYYSFDVAPNGRVSNPKVFKGSGDPALDAVGICVMTRLEFTPLVQNGRAIRAKVTWELPIRPPH